MNEEDYTESLYNKYRPKTLDDMVGQESAVKQIKEIPHFCLMTGPSGCGKTTAARVIRRFLKCHKSDYAEINCGDKNGIETVRGIAQRMNLSPLGGDCRMYLLDEAHCLTPEAQRGLLKILEEPPRRAYFILATTDPKKLLPTIQTRASEFKFASLGDRALSDLCNRVVEAENLKVSQTVIDEICSASDGSGRKALVILEQIGELSGDEEQIKGITTTVINKEVAFKLAQVVCNPRGTWKEAAVILKELKDDPEGIRHMILAYARTILLGCGPTCDHAFRVIDCFSRNFYDGKNAALAAACYEVTTRK